MFSNIIFSLIFGGILGYIITSLIICLYLMLDKEIGNEERFLAKLKESFAYEYYLIKVHYLKDFSELNGKRGHYYITFLISAISVLYITLIGVTYFTQAAYLLNVQSFISISFNIFDYYGMQVIMHNHSLNWAVLWRLTAIVAAYVTLSLFIIFLYELTKDLLAKGVIFIKFFGYLLVLIIAYLFVISLPQAMSTDLSTQKIVIQIEQNLIHQSQTEEKDKNLIIIVFSDEKYNYLVDVDNAKTLVVPIDQNIRGNNGYNNAIAIMPISIELKNLICRYLDSERSTSVFTQNTDYHTKLYQQYCIQTKEKLQGTK